MGVGVVRRSLFAALGLAAFAQAPTGPTPPCSGADVVVENARIVTMDGRDTVAGAMALEGERILYVGNVDQARKCAAGDVKFVDVGGRTVLPGLIDVHTHAQEWAKSLAKGDIDLNYPNVKSITEAMQLVRTKATTLPSGAWIVGFGWDDAKFAEKRYITHQDLDAVTGAHPAYLVHVSGHLGVANTAALKAAGITRDSADPVGGVIEKDATGEPTGVVKDTAMPLVARHLPPDPPDLARRAAKIATEEAAKYGLTTIHDIWVTPDEMRGYQQARDAGELAARVQITPGVRNLEDARRLVQTGVYTGFGDAWLKLGGVKMFADGGMGARTIAIYPPGVVGEPENIGLLLWKSEDMQAAHRVLARAGWQLITHAIGDRAIDQVLDSYAAVQKEVQPPDPRWRIAHGGVSTPKILQRLRDQKVIVDANPAFVYWIGSWFTKYGAERVRWSYPGKSYFDRGVMAGGASDVGVTPISPWWGIWSAVERKEMNTGNVLAPEERLTVQQALQLYTRNGAFIGREEREKGSLEPGKLADFIVVDRDILSVPTNQLKDVHVLATYVGGKQVQRVATGQTK